MNRLYANAAGLLALVFTASAGAQNTQPAPQTLSWQQIKTRFEAANPTLLAGELNIDESRANEITAFLRPNPDASLSIDGTQLTPYSGIYRPFAGTQYSPGLSYLHERRNKRELRLESAEKGTQVAVSQQQDLERNLLFNLRSAFVLTLQQKAVLQLAQDNLKYYQQVLNVSRDRFNAGDIARVDFDRLELQLVQYESDVQTALVNLRTAKIQLEQLLDEHTPIEQFDVTGDFTYHEAPMTDEEFRALALNGRPDLRAAMEAVEKAKTDHQLAVSNGSTDPTYSIWTTHNPSFNNPFDNNTIGASVSIPLRIFDRNQGEKERTDIDIRRNQRLADAARLQVFNDVDSAFATLNSNMVLLRRYRDMYLQEAVRVRDTIAFAYQNGGSSLLDFLSAQSDYRSVQLNYLNLTGAWMNSASQLNLAVGREVIQ